MNDTLFGQFLMQKTPHHSRSCRSEFMSHTHPLLFSQRYFLRLTWRGETRLISDESEH